MESLLLFEEKCGAKKQTQSSLGLDDLDAVRMNAYQLAVASDDEMFHSIFYDWFIDRGFTDDLLRVRAILFSFLFASRHLFAIRCDRNTLRLI